MDKNVKFLIIFLLIIIIVIYIINNNFRIAVVGNGPLTEEEITDINKYNIIVIMNNNKSGGKDIPIKATHLFLRKGGGGYFGWDKIKKKLFVKEETYKTLKHIILINNSSIKEDIINNNKGKNISVIPCTRVCNKSICTYKDNNYNLNKPASTGYLSINYMLEKYPLHNIHIYGMNSTKIGYHDMKTEKEMIKECRRCKIHKTHKDTYETFTVK